MAQHDAGSAIRLAVAGSGHGVRRPNLERVPATPKTDWKRPTRRRMRAIRDRLRAAYGKPIERPHRAPVDELIHTVLSQNTNDRNRDVAYARLTARFATWDEVRDAPTSEVEDAIRQGGLAPTKSLRIQEILRALGDDDLASLAEKPLADARAELCTLPGVGRKTAACVLMFAFGRPDIPVDTHVYRVGTRLGLFRPGAPLDEAHDELLRIVDPGDAHEIHVSLIRHGRRTCHARNPRCHDCPLLSLCAYGRALTRTRS
jgi:endonuclease-3